MSNLQNNDEQNNNTGQINLQPPITRGQRNSQPPITRRQGTSQPNYLNAINVVRNILGGNNGNIK